MRSLSPLRYPGGKAVLSDLLDRVICANGLEGCTYVEPFAGGAGAGLKLLEYGVVDRIVINDIDVAVYSMWNAMLSSTERFVEKIFSVPLDIAEWTRQRDTYRNGGRENAFNLGFATFYLNRCNRSGIIMNGGPIGGLEQDGEWKIDARFNRQELARRVEVIASYEDRVIVTNSNGVDLVYSIEQGEFGEEVFVYGDPPYFVKGRELYLNHFQAKEHRALSSRMKALKTTRWIMTYDDVEEVRRLYRWANVRAFSLRYSAHASSLQGGEVLIWPNCLAVPEAALEALQCRV
jgi:DNA adenine methylase